MKTNINLELINFLKNLENNLKLNSCNIDGIVIKCKISENDNIDKDKCHALVHNLNGTIYQCTRKKKYGCFCGLHHNRKNDFKTVKNNKSYTENVYKLDLNKSIVQKNLDDIYKVYHNYNEYYIESSTGTIYIDEYDDNFTKKLVPIDNINNSNLPFTIV